MKQLSLLVLCFILPSLRADDSNPAPAPAADRVGFPRGYAQNYQILRIVNKPADKKIITVYGNTLAASVTNAAQLPYPYGSVLVMETATALKDSDGKLSFDANKNLRKNKVVGLHVMRREKGFGEAYGKNRAGEWEFVEYKPDSGFLTPPQQSATCAECHLKAGPERDFVYRGRLPEKRSQ